MQLIQKPAQISRCSIALPLVALMVVAGCAKKQPLPSNAADLGLNSQNTGSAKPGSTQDFTVNIGDRVFFTTDSTSLSAKARTTLINKRHGLAGTIPIKLQLKVMPTNAVRANTTWRWAHVAPLPHAIISLPVVYRGVA